MKQPSPITVVGKQCPHRVTERAGEMCYRSIHGDNQIHTDNGGGGFGKISQVACNGNRHYAGKLILTFASLWSALQRIIGAVSICEACESLER